jgi:transposase
MRIDIAQQACPCCGGELHRIGETVSEMLDHVPARLRVIRISAGLAMAAGPAALFTKPLPRNGRSPGAWPLPAFSPMS